VWALARRQHGAVTRQQLRQRGFSSQAIAHRVKVRRLYPVFRAVYAVGRPELTLPGRWLAAVLSCGPGAALSHESAAALWGIRAPPGSEPHVSVPANLRPRRSGIVVHRRTGLEAEHLGRRDAIPLTAPAVTLADLAACHPRGELEAAINEADRLDLIDPETLRAALDQLPRWPGVRVLRELLDRRTFRLTDSELERRFLRLACGGGVPPPRTADRLNGFKVDFCWPELGLVVETDGLRYHRTPAEQARDRLRDQVHTAAGFTSLRFTHAQVRFDPAHVKATLIATVERLRQRADREAAPWTRQSVGAGTASASAVMPVSPARRSATISRDRERSSVRPHGEPRIVLAPLRVRSGAIGYIMQGC
jgi:very-short-patch-repair endonuclease